MKLPLAAIIWDEECYPRNQPDWLTVYRYQEAMKAGAAFPPIVVGRKAGQWMGLDGRHRALALKKNGVATASVLVSKVPPAEFFLESVRLNAANGRPLSTQERIAAAARLEAQGYGREKISKALFMPVETIRRLMVDRVLRPPTAKNVMPLVRKAPAGRDVASAEEQRMLAASDAAAVLLQAVTILERGWYDPMAPEVADLLLRLTAWARSFRVAPAVRQQRTRR